jgi:hypothetical protein
MAKSKDYVPAGGELIQAIAEVLNKEVRAVRTTFDDCWG